MNRLIAVFLLAGATQATQVAVAADIVGNPAAAPAKIEMCIGCHAIPGYKATFPEVFQVPKIGGQNARYIEAALKGYQKGDRKHPSMKGIAVSLSDQDIAVSLSDQDIADIAAYYAKQK